MKTIRVLILEDDLEAVCRLVGCLNTLEKEFNIQIAITVLSEYIQAEKLNTEKENIFDIILLDRDTFDGGSFHVIDFNKYQPEKIIGISSIPPYNEELRQKGVKRLVWKDFQHLDKFVEEVNLHIKDMLLKA